MHHLSPYQSEADLVEAIVAAIEKAKRSPWAAQTILREFPHTYGRTDLVVVVTNGRVIALEAKLALWRDALRQASRSLSYAHEAYVVLPRPYVYDALANEGVFRDFGVGICTMRQGCIEVLLGSVDHRPYSTTVTARALGLATEELDTH